MMDNTFNQAFKPLSNIKTIKEYETEIEALRNENFELKSCLSQNQKPTVVTDDIKKLLQDSQTSINILENENNELKNQIQYLNNGQNNHLALENEKLLKYIEKMNKEVEMQNERHSEEKKDMYKEICNLKDKIGNIGNIESVNNQLQQQYKLLNEELQRTTHSNKQLKLHYNNEMQNKANEYEGKIQLLNTEIAKLQAINKKTAEETTDKNNDLQSKATFFEQKSYELQNKIKKLEEEVSSNKITIEDLLNDKQQLNKKNIDLQNFIEEHKKQKLNTTNNQDLQINELKNKNNNLNQEIVNLKDQLNSLNNKNNNLLNENKRFKDESDTIKAKISSKDTYINNLQSKINKYEVYLNKIKQEGIKIQNENKTLLGQKEFLETQLTSKKMQDEKNFSNKDLEDRINNLVRINNVYCKFLNEESMNKKKIYETLLVFKKRINNYLQFIISMRNNYGRSKMKENNYNQNVKSNNQDLMCTLNNKNINFVRKLFPNQNNLNVIISELSRLHDRMCSKIDTLEGELRQITYFAENNARNKNSKTINLIDNFVVEFQSAKEELEFCKNYLKEKGKELKELKKSKIKNENRIQELEDKLKNNRSTGGFMDYFTSNKQTAR